MIGIERPGLGKPRVIDFKSGVYAFMDMETLVGIHAANVGLIITPRTMVLINSGQTEAQARYIWEFTQMRAPSREMIYLILTHHHLDHCFAASFFDDRHALIYAHKTFASQMAEMRKHLGAGNYQEMLCAFLKISDDECKRTIGNVHPISPHRHVGDEVSLAINGEEVMILHVPGHTPSELVCYHPPSKVLFAGDAINTKAGPVTMFGDHREWRKWVAGLEKLKKLDIESVVPGHGDVSGPEVIDQHIEILEQRIAEAVK